MENLNVLLPLMAMLGLGSCLIQYTSSKKAQMRLALVKKEGEKN